MRALKPSVIQLVPQDAALRRLGHDVLIRDCTTNTGESVDSDKKVTGANSDLLGLKNTT